MLLKKYIWLIELLLITKLDIILLIKEILSLANKARDMNSPTLAAFRELIAEERPFLIQEEAYDKDQLKLEGIE